MVFRYPNKDKFPHRKDNILKKLKNIVISHKETVSIIVYDETLKL